MGGTSGLRRLGAALILVAAISACLPACTFRGEMSEEEVYYLAAPGEDNTNYFRIRVHARTYLGKSEYRSGWFPAETVDRLYGSTLEPGPASAYKTREDIQVMLNDAIKETTQGYLTAAKNPKTTGAEIESWLIASRRVRAIASDGVPLPEGAVEIEYDPMASLALRHAGEKLIFVLSSDPDQVINNIKNFAEHDKTSAAVLRMADVIKQQAANQVIQTEAENDANTKLDQLLVAQIDSMLTFLESAEGVDRDQFIQEVEALSILVENLR